MILHLAHSYTQLKPPPPSNKNTSIVLDAQENASNMLLWHNLGLTLRTQLMEGPPREY